jgi:transcriptional regulator of acetoin/glycerol metabolism
VTLPALLRRAIKHARAVNHAEVTFESQHQFIDAVVTLKPIVEEQGNSFILLLHPVEQMRQLMTSQLGKVSHTFEQMPADDPQTRRLIQAGRQAARGAFPVLLYGEEGVGKELMSQAIHNESERAGGRISPLTASCMPTVRWGWILWAARRRKMRKGASAAWNWPMAVRCFWKKSSIWPPSCNPRYCR